MTPVEVILGWANEYLDRRESHGVISHTGPLPAHYEVQDQLLQDSYTPKQLIRAICDRHGWSLNRFSRETGINRCTITNVMHDLQKGMYPESQERIKRVVRNDNELGSMFLATEWGESATKRRMR